MKRAILFLVLTIGVLKAQQNKWDRGIITGPGSTYIKTSYLALRGSQPAMGAYCGFYLQYNFPKIFSIETNLAYDLKRTAYNMLLTDAFGNHVGTFTEQHEFNYLTIPLLLKAGFGKKLRCFVAGGFYYSRLLKMRHITIGNDYKMARYDNTYNYERSDFGVSYGIGVSYPMSKKFSVFTQLRMNTGLYDIGPARFIDRSSPPIKMNSGNILVGICYNAGQRTK